MVLNEGIQVLEKTSANCSGSLFWTKPRGWRVEIDSSSAFSIFKVTDVGFQEAQQKFLEAFAYADAN